jgi:hypothetical protein
MYDAPPSLCVRSLDILKLQRFVLHNTDTISFPISSPRFLRYNKHTFLSHLAPRYAATKKKEEEEQALRREESAADARAAAGGFASGSSDGHHSIDMQT